MSADSEPPSPEPAVPPPAGEAPPAPPTGEDTAAPEYLPQKRRYKKPEPAAFDFGEVPDETDDEILILGTLLQRLLARKQAESAEPETRSKINRFVQRNTAPLAPAPTSGDSTTDPAATDDAGATPPEGIPATDTVPARPAPRPLPKLMPRPVTATGDAYWSPPSRGRGVLYLVFCAGLAIAAFLVGRSAAHSNGAASGSAAPAATPAPQWNATLLGKLDQVLAADQSGELEKARAAALDLKKQIGNSLELDLYLATLTTRLGHNNDAEADLSRMLEPYMQPLQAAAVNEGMAFTYSRRRDFKRAAEAFADASRINPFAPENFYLWGEVLRRQGRFQDAIDKFRQALQRLPEGNPANESQRECAAFKMRVAQIELGRDADIKPEIDNHLRQPSPSGYWLLTAAAFALQHSDTPGAVGFLQKAHEALSSEQYATLTNDYFFHAYAEKPELSHVLSIPSAEAKQKDRTKMVYFVDP